MSLLAHHNLIGGSNFHPLYHAVLSTGIGASYDLPSYANMVIQNNLVTSMYLNGIWPHLDYLYILADDSGSNDMGRINWIYPSNSTASLSPTYVSKKGIYGSQTFNGFDIAVDRVAMDANDNASMFAWLTENGGTISVIEALASIGAVGNARFQTIRLRTNPRVDCLMNQTTAGPQVVYAGFPNDNHFYHIDMGNISSVVHFTITINGSTTVNNFPVASGSLPSDGELQMNNVDSSRAVGIIGGGGSIFKHGLEGLLYDNFNTYMTAVQAL